MIRSHINLEEIGINCTDQIHIRKKYYLRKSSARKPYLDRNRHVRKYRNNMNYKNKLECFTCGSSEHLANTCPKKYNSRTRNAQLIIEFKKTLINVDEYMSDTESIYSVVSIEITENDIVESSDYKFFSC